MGKTSIARLEHEIFFDQVMLEHLSHVEDIKVVLLRKDKRVLHKSSHSVLIIVLNKVVVCVSSIDLVVMRVIKH